MEAPEGLPLLSVMYLMRVWLLSCTLYSLLGDKSMRKLILFLATLVIGVLLSMPVLADTIVTQYSLDGNNWTEANAYTATSDTKLYYRTYNQTKGIASATKSIRLLVDKQAPTPPIVSYAKNNQWTNSPPVMQWSSNDTGGSGIAKYQYWRSDTGNWQDYGTGTSWTPEQNKNISIKWRAVDGAGNISPESNTVQVKTDNTPPNTTVTTTDKARNEAEISLKIWDDLSDVDFVILPDGTKWSPGDQQP